MTIVRSPSTPLPASPAYSITTLEETPRRALEFLRGIGGSPEILRLMIAAGYTQKAHEEGQRLLAHVVGFVAKSDARLLLPNGHTAALETLAAWYRQVFRRLRAAVTRYHADIAEELFGGLDVGDDMDEALLARVFVERVEALSKDDGKGGRRDKNAVLQILAERGFGGHEMKELRKLLAIVETPATESLDPPPDESAADRQARIAKLTELREWYGDWSETARAILVRRDQAIRVGIAHRRRTTTAPPPSPQTPRPTRPSSPTYR